MRAKKQERAYRKCERRVDGKTKLYLRRARSHYLFAISDSLLLNAYTHTYINVEPVPGKSMNIV